MTVQKIPIRSMLRASPGKVLLAFDFSQAESWVVAHLANSNTMKEALKRAGTPFDIHYTTTRGIYDYSDDIIPSYDERYMGKKFNHSGSYGTSAQMIAHMINSESIYPPYLSITIAQAKRMHEKWLALYSDIPRWWFDIQRQLEASSTLKTPYGRERRFYQQWGPSLFKEAYAYIPQSTVGDHCLGATHPELGIIGGVYGIYKEIAFPSNGEVVILNSSHDSVIVEAPLKIANEVAEHTYNLLYRPLIVNGEEFKIPVDAEIGERWGELEPLKLAA